MDDVRVSIITLLSSHSQVLELSNKSRGDRSLSKLGCEDANLALGLKLHLRVRLELSIDVEKVVNATKNFHGGSFSTSTATCHHLLLLLLHCRSGSTHSGSRASHWWRTTHWRMATHWWGTSHRWITTHRRASHRGMTAN